MAEITHRPENGKMIQVVTPERLREILDEYGDDYERPDDFNPGDEWEVAGYDDCDLSELDSFFE